MEKPTLYGALIEPLRLADEQGDGLLRRILEKPQEIMDRIEDSIRSLEETDDPARCPDRLLRHLKAHVGFASDLDPAFDEADALTLRRLIGVAIPFWRTKGTAQGLLATARALTGREPWLIDWFDARLLVEEFVVGPDRDGAGTVLLGDDADRTTQLRVMDDGSLAPGILLELVRLSRPAGERIEVVLLDFLDRFSGTRDRWESAGAAASIEDGIFSLPPGALERAVLTTVSPFELTNYVVTLWFRLAESGDRLQVRWFDTARMMLLIGGYYELSVSDASPQLRLELNAGSGPTTIYEADLTGGISMVPGAWYQLRVEALRSGDVPFFRLWVDEVLQYESSDGGEATPSIVSGDVSVGADSGNTGVIGVDDVEVWRVPARVATVGPAGVTLGPGWE